jgi:hypothetical protein
VTDRTRTDLECELRSLRYEVRRATEELDRAGVGKYDTRPRIDSTDDSEGTEWSIQKRIKLLAAREYSKQREEKLRDALIFARSELHRALLERGSTDSYGASFEQINVALGNGDSDPGGLGHRRPPK